MRARIIKFSLSISLLILTSYAYFKFHSPERAIKEFSTVFTERTERFLNQVSLYKKSATFKKLDLATDRGLGINPNIVATQEQLHDHSLELQIFVHKELRFWSDNVNEIGNVELFPEGLSFQRLKTGWFLVHKTRKLFKTIIFSCPVRFDYEFPNQFLRNGFSGFFDIPNYLKIVNRPSGLSQPIYNPQNGSIMGFLKLDLQLYHQSLDQDQIYGLALMLFLFFYIIREVCIYARQKKLIYISVLFGIILPFLATYGLSRFFLNLRLDNWPVFDSKLYEDLPIFHSLEEFTLALLFLFWLLYFFQRLLPPIRIREKLQKGWVWLGFACLAGMAFFASFLFQSLIIHAKVPFDLTNIFNLNSFTFLTFLLTALTWIWFYYATTGLSRLIHRYSVDSRSYSRFLLFLPIFLISFYIYGLNGFFLTAGISGILVFLFLSENLRPVYRLGIFLLAISFLASILMGNFTSQMEKDHRIEVARQLGNSRDPEAESRLNEIGNDIFRDSSLTNYIKGSAKENFRVFNQEIQKIYFERDFPNYDIQSYIYSPKGSWVYGPDNIPLEIYEQVAKNANTRKIPPFFYQGPGKLGLNNYFGIIPLFDAFLHQYSGTLVIRLNARFIRENNAFTELLLDQKELNFEKNGVYSYAFYKDGNLIDKYGKYPYSIEPNEFNPLSPHKTFDFLSIRGFDHLLFQVSKGNLIVVSLPSLSFYKQATLFSYLFGFYFACFGLVGISIYLFGKFKQEWRTIRFLYKTRIQVSIIASVFLSLVGIGWITLVYVNNQYNLQQQDLLSNQLNNLREIFEREMPTDSIGKQNERFNREFLDFAAGHSQDLNLYSTEGNLLYTSLPKVFERGLLSPYMSPEAFFEMFVSGRTEYIHNETIGKLTFLSGYTPVRNNNNQVVGYLNLPYFANQIELKQRLSSFSNTLVNVYFITFLLIGVFSVGLANSLTNPLNLVQESFRSTKIGNVNLPISWKRDDEIGDLIAEYNKMIKTIEESANKLARSERESAWREMAKQVAHEIKNPLTPLKLGIQHLERAWKEKDPLFDEKFRRFSKTFVEQIDSLSAISSEFSNFAQMPQAHEEEFDLVEVLETVLNLFKALENIQLDLIYPQARGFSILADRDQISRAFTNLIKNATQSIPENQLGIIKVELYPSEHELVILIKDNGSGIPEALYPKIFQPNFTTKGSGTGLGLAFVKNVIEQTGGKIEFKSEINKGTTFMVHLPLIKS